LLPDLPTVKALSWATEELVRHVQGLLLRDLRRFGPRGPAFVCGGQRAARLSMLGSRWSTAAGILGGKTIRGNAHGVCVVGPCSQPVASFAVEFGSGCGRVERELVFSADAWEVRNENADLYSAFAYARRGGWWCKASFWGAFKRVLGAGLPGWGGADCRKKNSLAILCRSACPSGYAKRFPGPGRWSWGFDQGCGRVSVDERDFLRLSWRVICRVFCVFFVGGQVLFAQVAGLTDSVQQVGIAGGMRACESAHRPFV